MADDRHMRRALELAQGHRTHPNPRVGAVVISSRGEVVGEGFHIGPGEVHGEVMALEAAGKAARGGTLYTTLEPCNHHGRTPPCVDAIVGAGIARVVAAIADPDQRVSGSGFERLQSAGVEVVTGVLADNAAMLNAAYLHHRETGMPLVTAKWAMTLDGTVAAVDGSSRWISSEESREDAHVLRAESDAVVVGAGTVRTDDPLLTVRAGDHAGRQPSPVIIAGEGALPQKAALWSRDPVVISAASRRVPAGEVVVVEATESGLPDPVSACRAIADLGHLAVLLEGGPTLIGSWWNAGVVDRGVIYLSAKIAGGAGLSAMAGVFENINDAETVSITGVRSLGADYRIDFSRK